VVGARELVEAEISAEVVAEIRETTPELRMAHCDGSRPRHEGTRGGELELPVPKMRQGRCFPSFLDPRRPSEQAIVAVLLSRVYERASAPGRPGGSSSSFELMG
jgi:putative transposase